MTARRLTTPLQLTNKTIATISAEYLTGNRMDLSPSYQRARCWSQAQNNGLISSIMNGWPTPLLTFYKLHPTNPDDTAAYAAGLRYECVDGQNRLCAIRAFLTGRPIINDKNGKEEAVSWLCTAEAGITCTQYADLDEADREFFTEYVMAITIIQEPMTLAERRAMFTRLQDGTKISTAEYVKNSEHPVSQFVSRTGLRDRFLPVVTGMMTAAKGIWMDVLADCVTLWIRRTAADPLASLRRTQADLRANLRRPKAQPAGSPLDMPLTVADDAPLTAIFDQLLTILTAVKADRVKCHMFHVTLLFYCLATERSIPEIAILRAWFAASYKEGIFGSFDGTMATDAAVRESLLALLGTVTGTDTEVKPKRRAIPKKKRETLWIRHFESLTTPGVCSVCASAIDATKWEQAHIVAVAAGGTNDLDNLVPTCVSCNRSCGDEDLRTFAAREWPAAPLLSASSASS